MNEQLYRAIIENRPDVAKVLGNSRKAVEQWWNSHGKSELLGRLGKIGRNDIVRAASNPNFDVGNWYAYDAPKEYKNVWKDSQKMTEAERLGIVEPKQVTAFSEVLPYETVFNPNLITGLAASQLSPEIDRQYNQSARSLQGQLSSSGAFRTGLAGTSIRGLQDSTERQRKESIQSFTDTINNMGRDWYNREAENYYKSPSTYAVGDLPNFDDFMSANPSAINAYNNATAATDNTYKSPLLF